MAYRRGSNFFKILTILKNPTSCVCVLSHVQLSVTPWNRSLPVSSVLGIFQARILEQFAISFSRGSSQPRDRTHMSCISYIGRQILYQ